MNNKIAKNLKEFDEKFPSQLSGNHRSVFREPFFEPKVNPEEVMAFWEKKQQESVDAMVKEFSYFKNNLVTDKMDKEFSDLLKRIQEEKQLAKNK